MTIECTIDHSKLADKYLSRSKNTCDEKVSNIRHEDINIT